MNEQKWKEIQEFLKEESQLGFYVLSLNSDFTFESIAALPWRVLEESSNSQMEEARVSEHPGFIHLGPPSVTRCVPSLFLFPHKICIIRILTYPLAEVWQLWSRRMFGCPSIVKNPRLPFKIYIQAESKFSADHWVSLLADYIFIIINMSKKDRPNPHHSENLCGRQR